MLLRLDRNRLRANIATLYGVGAKVASATNWLVVAMVVSTQMSRATQGYFFTFLSLATLQMLFDLGLGMAVIQFAAHEWALIHGNSGQDDATAAAGRLRSVARFALYWYAAGGIVFLVALQPIGYLFFAHSASAGAWPGPWLLLSATVAFDLMTMGVWSLLEGCQQLHSVYRYRAVKAVVFGVATWASILGGCGLYSLGIGYLATLPVSLGMLMGNNLRLLRSILASSASQSVSWRTEILPLQWRLAISFSAAYFAQWGVTPMTFKLFNPVVAGQFGMMWSIINSLSAVANVVVAVRAPQFGVLIASRRYGELDRLARKVTFLSVGLFLLGSVAVASVIYVLGHVGSPLAKRVLPLDQTLIMLVAATAGQLIYPLAIYLRSHKKEPYLWLSVIFAAGLVLGTSVAARWFGPSGVPIAYFLLVTCFMLPAGTWIFVRCRALWHKVPVCQPTA
jgi:hypothetical protein